MLILVACHEEKETRPAGILPEHDMIELLADLHLTEASIQLNNLAASDSSRKIAEGYYKNVFIKHHVTSAQFDSSFQYYTKRPEQLSVVYDSVLARLSQIKAHTAETSVSRPDSVQKDTIKPVSQ